MWPFAAKRWVYMGHHYVGVVMVGHHPTHEYVVEFNRAGKTVKVTKQFHAGRMDYAPHDTAKLATHFAQLAETMT